MNKLFMLIFINTLLSLTCFANPHTDEVIAMSNKMMLSFMEKMQQQDFVSARAIAQKMVEGYEELEKDTQKTYKSFHSAMEHALYKLTEERIGNDLDLEWISQPISDGFYLLAILDFQENQHKEALENIQQAIFWNPVHSAFYCELGFMMLNNLYEPDVIMSQAAYLKALSLADDPQEFAAALQGLASVFIEKKQSKLALAALLVANDYEDTNKVAQEQMRLLLKDNPPLISLTTKESYDYLKEKNIQTTYSSEHIEVLLSLSEEQAKKGEKDHAKALLEKAKKMDPQNLRVFNRLKQFK